MRKATTRLNAGLLAGTTLVTAAMWSAGALAQEITVWSGYPELGPFYEHVAEGMKADYPDLKVTVEPIALREHERRVALELASGGGQALVLEMDAAIATRYIENGLLPVVPDEIAEFVTNGENYVPFFANSGQFEGEVYGVPLFNSQVALYYNLDKFAAAGLTEPPATMEEYTEYAKKLTERDANGNPVVSGWSLRLAGGGQGIAEKFWINLHQFGGALLEQRGDGWIANYANDAGVAALKQYLDLIYVDKTVTQEMPADAEAFEREQTAMFIRESWVIGDIAAKAPDLNYATAPLPRGAISLPNNLYVRADGAEAEAAWAFVLAANEPDNLNWLLANVGWLPVRANVDYSEVINNTPGFAAFLDLPEDYELFTLPSIGPIQEVLTRVAATLTDLFGAPSAPSDDELLNILQQMQDETNAILSREGILAS